MDGLARMESTNLSRPRWFRLRGDESYWEISPSVRVHSGRDQLAVLSNSVPSFFQQDTT